MDDSNQDALAASVRVYRHRLDHLAAEGRRLQTVLGDSPESADNLAALRAWQRECAATISGLAGGSKAHWLARKLSDAVLVPLAGSESVSVTTIVDRILSVLSRAHASLAEAIPGPGPDTRRERFSFVGDEALRSGLEHAYLDGQAAFSRGEFALALVTFASILETVITHLLGRRGPETLAPLNAPSEPMATWPFVTRITMAERSHLISNGCARLPELARGYRTLLDEQGEILPDALVSPRDAKLTRDVLHVILRDLAPGR